MRDRYRALLILAGALIVYFVIYNDFPPYRINDSAVEILQIRDFDFWSIQSLVGTYAGGGVDVIESLYPYLASPFVALLGDGISTFVALSGLVFGLTVTLFYILLRTRFSERTAVLGSVFYMFSAYSIWQPMILTRNMFSALFLCLGLVGINLILNNRRRFGFVACYFFGVLGIFTYSSFKVVVPAVFLSGLIAMIFCGSNKKHILALVVAGVASAATCFLIIWVSPSEIDFFLFRGKYMIEHSDLGRNKDLFTYLLFFGRSLSLPVFQSPRGFMSEPAHALFGRAMLSMMIIPIFLLGSFKAIQGCIERNAFSIIVILSFLLSAALLCLGGPSLKTHYVLWPLVMLMVVMGLDCLVQLKLKFVFPSLAIVAALNLYLEYNFLQNDVKNRVNNWPESVGHEISIYLNANKSEYDFVFYKIHMGLDSSRLFFPDWKTKSRYVYPNENISRAVEEAVQKYSMVWLIAPVNDPYDLPCVDAAMIHISNTDFRRCRLVSNNTKN